MAEVYTASRADAFVRLLAQHERGVYALILSLMPNWADADEVLQETKVRLWEQFDRYTDGTDFGAWARTVAQYQVMNYRRQKGRERCRFSTEFIERMVEQAQADDLAVARHEALSVCLKRLPERNRKLLRDYYAVDAIPREIAARHERSIQSLRLTLFRVRRALRGCIERRLNMGALDHE